MGKCDSARARYSAIRSVCCRAQGSAAGIYRPHTDVLRDPIIRSENMKRFGHSSKPLPWISAMLLAVLAAGCGGGGGSTDNSFGAVCAGAACVPLGAAGQYAILAKSGISSVPASAITGHLGLSPAAATFITGFSLTADSTNVFSTSSQVTGKVYAANYASPTPSNLTTAVLNMQAAYTDAAGRAPDAGKIDLFAGAIGSQTLTPGVYKW